MSPHFLKAEQLANLQSYAAYVIVLFFFSVCVCVFVRVPLTNETKALKRLVHEAHPPRSKGVSVSSGSRCVRRWGGF